jgi:hypothetical protein
VNLVGGLRGWFLRNVVTGYKGCVLQKPDASGRSHTYSLTQLINMIYDWLRETTWHDFDAVLNWAIFISHTHIRLCGRKCPVRNKSRRLPRKAASKPLRIDSASNMQFDSFFMFILFLEFLSIIKMLLHNCITLTSLHLFPNIVFFTILHIFLPSGWKNERHSLVFSTLARYSEDRRFKLGRLFYLKFFYSFSKSVQVNAWMVSAFGDGLSLPHSFGFVMPPTFRRHGIWATEFIAK